MKPIDIFITAYERQALTGETIRYLRSRTKYPYRLFLIDNGGNHVFKDAVDFYIGLSNNVGIHCAWNIALGMAESDYFITSDNDIYVPDLTNKLFGIVPGDVGYSAVDTDDKTACWLERMVKYMDEKPEYAAISLHPHVFIGAASIDPQDYDDVKERNMCGAVMRIMRREAVQKVGGWEHKIEAGRNHEERWICGKLQEAGWKTGIASRIRAFHPFPPNWGYPKEFTPEDQKHNPDLKEYVTQFNNMDGYDNKTWLPK